MPATTDAHLPDERLPSLLDQALADRAAGRTPDLDALCRDRPDLRWPLAEALKAVGKFTVTEQPTQTVPPTVPGFELRGELGRGGMGVVYRARDLALNRDVAVKLLGRQVGPGSGVARRFLAEAAITGQLQHPGIPAVYQMGTAGDGRPFLAMKLIKGDTLADLLAAKPDRGRLVAVFEGVCQAVGYAHAHGVIHRDLKPANVMVGAFGEVQVMDWGLAKVLGEADPPAADPEATTGTEIASGRDDSDHTQDGHALGTPAYMPPEQAVGSVAEMDQRSDVFGLGAVLCALLTGKPPYVGGDAGSTRGLAAQAKLADALARLDGCGAEPDLVALCKRCLTADRAARPADAGEVAEAVAALRAAADERARRAELEAVRVDEGRKRLRLAAVAGGLALAVALAGSLFATVSVYRVAEGQQWVAHSHETSGTVDQVLLALTDAETGVRGFNLSGREDLLVPYTTARPRLEAALRELAALTTDNADQSARVAQLRRMAAERMELLDRGVQAKRINPALTYRPTDYTPSQQMMADVRRTVAEIRVEEHRLLYLRVAEARATQQQVYRSFLLAVVVVLALAAGMLAFARRQ